MSSEKDRLEWVDVLRCIAALSVVLYHARSLIWVGSTAVWADESTRYSAASILGYLSLPFSFGFLGVPIFFVLSGYCIHRRAAFARETDQVSRIDWWRYARRRAWRILPVYCAALIIVGATERWLIHPEMWQVLTRTPEHSATSFLATLAGTQGLLAPQFGTSAVFWTLAVEMQLYAAYPILFWISKKFGLSAMMVMTFAISLIFQLAVWPGGWLKPLPFHIEAGYTVFVPFWFTWSLGMLLAEINAGKVVFHPLIKNARIAWPILLLIGGLMFRKHGIPGPGEMASALGACGLVWTCMDHGRAFTTQRFRPMVWLGVASYSIYAVHEIALLAFKSVFAPGRGTFAHVGWVLPASVWALAWGLGLYWCIERWFIRRSQPVPT